MACCLCAAYMRSKGCDVGASATNCLQNTPTAPVPPPNGAPLTASCPGFAAVQRCQQALTHRDLGALLGADAAGKVGGWTGLVRACCRCMLLL